MKIRIKTYANLGSSDYQIDLDKDNSVEKLLDKISISKKETFIILINGKKSNLSSILTDGDSVSIFPFIGGG